MEAEEEKGEEDLSEVASISQGALIKILTERDIRQDTGQEDMAAGKTGMQAGKTGMEEEKEVMVKEVRGETIVGLKEEAMAATESPEARARAEKAEAAADLAEADLLEKETTQDSEASEDNFKSPGFLDNLWQKRRSKALADGCWCL